MRRLKGKDAHGISMNSQTKSALIGDKKFYRHLLVIVVPILIQNFITNFVNMLDNIMVGQVGTNPMSGVSIVNQLLFIFNLCIFGGTAGAGIYTAQFYGQQNHDGIRYTFKFKLWIAVIIDVIAISVLLLFGDQLIGLYLHSGEAAANASGGEEILKYAKQYLTVMFFEMIPFSISQAYASTLRESNDTVLPMKAGIVAIIINLCLNYILIYGKLGFPTLGVVGAALATAISRYVEAGIIVIYTHTHSVRHQFIKGAYRRNPIPDKL
ncbi:MAG: polysaccharide biosynthesis C-terminal domain-containing protein, partial [Lachnospiraceae bacterium]|nr:polysaccharide biosynthesis C-terminal domain-containing protein [Lachnospiraceae bacterium]